MSAYSILCVALGQSIIGPGPGVSAPGMKLLATKSGGDIKISGVMFGDTADIEVTTAEALRKQYRVADSAKATGFPIKIPSPPASTNAIRCSFLVEYANDQPTRRHCLASKQELRAFLLNERDSSFIQNVAKWLVQDGAFVVSLKTATSSPFLVH